MCPSMNRINRGIVFLLIAGAGLAIASTSANFINDPGEVPSGADTTTSPDFSQHGVIGQKGIGIASSPNYIHAAGFDAMVSIGAGAVVLDGDSFPSGPGPNWSVVSGSWNVVGGALVSASGAGPDSIRSNAPQIANARIDVKVRVASGTPVVATVFRAASNTLDGNNQYWVELDTAANVIRLMKDVAGVESAVASAPFTFVAGTPYALRVKFAGNDFRVLLDGTQKICLPEASIAA
jgi:hypothetical protein